MQNELPQFTLKKCIGCAHCGAYCPVNAYGLELLSPSNITSMDYIKLLKARRSVRKYNDRTVSDEIIEDLLSVVSQSPTGVNAQGITVKVISGKENITALLKPVRKFLNVIRFTGIPALIGKLTGTTKFLKYFQAGADPIFRGAPVVIFVYAKRNSPTGNSDAVIAATLIMLHAETLGMGTLWNGIALAISRLLRAWPPNTDKNIGKLHAVLCIGYPERHPVSATPDRTWQQR